MLPFRSERKPVTLLVLFQLHGSEARKGSWWIHLAKTSVVPCSRRQQTEEQNRFINRALFHFFTTLYITCQHSIQRSCIAVSCSTALKLLVVTLVGKGDSLNPPKTNFSTGTLDWGLKDVRVLSAICPLSLKSCRICSIS